MEFKINGKEQELKFTFNSMKLIDDLDFQEMEEMERKPLKMMSITSMLLFGAVNHNPKVKFRQEDVDVALNEYLESGESMPDLFTGLMELLTESSFFKSLQETAEKTE